ncbi:MAG: prepilin-type N-terminal cleavage/methylation domain-containing protein [Elusimicrobiaceae bacterium]|nr:prepilin-type N-terminal cleavage/methylation domain-containing protein [Elusimicrobiaceae bacterium]
MQKNKQAFTLVELLVVVLIIGVLSAIAIPMYQGAVDKSHWSTMLPGAKAIKDAEEAIKMTNGSYTDEMANLDVTMNNTDLTFALVTPNNTADPNVIRVTNSKLDNVRLASYLDESPTFAGQLHCEAATGDERANRLCGGLLQGQELNAEGGYTRYLLDQSVDKATCDEVDGFFGQKTAKCYKTNADRCVGLGMSYNETTQFCGYKVKGEKNLEVGEGGVCEGIYQYSSGGCQNSTFTNATCVAASDGCNGSDFSNSSVCVSSSVYAQSGCRNAVFDDSLCISRSFYGGCDGGTFSNDSVCYETPNVNGSYGCKHATYNDSSCCCGNCGDKPACSPERCAMVKQQVDMINGQYVH